MDRASSTPIRTFASLGAVISTRRKALGMTQEELSSLSGIAQPNLSNIERGVADGRLDTYLKICALIGIDLFAVPRP
jgi:HTH-type transcriptional regulator / antitoxin HipB